MKDNRVPLRAHLSMFTAEVIWGLMSPIAKSAMNSGFDGVSVVSFRVAGAAVLFWLASFVGPREHIPAKDILKLAGAGLLGIVFNQCLFNIGNNIFGVFNTHAKTHQVGADTAFFQLLVRQLAVGGGSRVQATGSRICHVGDNGSKL